MTTSALTFIAYAVAAFVLYGIIARGLFRATESLRLSLLDLSKPLLAHGSVSSSEKAQIDSALDHVHSARSAWWLVVALILTILELMFRRGAVDNIAESVPPHLQGTYDTFRLRWIVATLGNSPLAAFCFTTTLIVLFAFAASTLPVAMLLQRRATPVPGRSRAAHV